MVEVGLLGRLGNEVVDPILVGLFGLVEVFEAFARDVRTLPACLGHRRVGLRSCLVVVQVGVDLTQLEKDGLLHRVGSHLEASAQDGIDHLELAQLPVDGARLQQRIHVRWPQLPGILEELQGTRAL